MVFLVVFKHCLWWNHFHTLCRWCSSLFLFSQCSCGCSREQPSSSFYSKQNIISAAAALKPVLKYLSCKVWFQLFYSYTSDPIKSLMLNGWTIKTFTKTMKVCIHFLDQVCKSKYGTKITWGKWLFFNRILIIIFWTPTWQDLVLLPPLFVCSGAEEAGGGPGEAVVGQPGVLLSDEQSCQEALGCLLIILNCDLDMEEASPF